MSEDKRELPINKGRLLIEQAKGTIKSVVDAIVELVTNADDSFKNLEQSGATLINPSIKIVIKRKTRGNCEELTVVDNASGMSKVELLEAIRFGAETSGFKEGKRVRGFLGRGLKESIIALGKGMIITKKSGEISGVKIWIEEENGELRVFDSEIEDKLFLKSQMAMQISEENNGTIIAITDIYDNFKIPTRDYLFDQIKKHYQLRDINSSPNRDVVLEFHELEKKIKTNWPIKYIYPQGKIKLEKEIVVDDKISYLKIYESEEQLDSPVYDILGEAGILIKTEGSILEDYFSKFSGEEAGLYFFGSLDDPEIANRLRKK